MISNCIAFLLLLLPRPALCSGGASVSKDWESLKPTPHSLSCFAAHLAGGETDPLVIELRSRLSTSHLHQRLCLKYLVGSVAVFGQVDKDAWRALYKLCRAQRMVYLLDLLRRVKKSGCGAVLEFKHDEYRDPIVDLLEELVKEDWDAARTLIVEGLDALKGSASRRHVYIMMLGFLSAGRLYELIHGREISLSVICKICSDKEPNSKLREIFALARCSADPSPRIRKYIAKKHPHFGQFLPDKAFKKNIVLPCPAHIPTLGGDVLLHMFMFLDVESLIFVLPLVCALWHNWHPKVLTLSTKIHDLYLQDMHSLVLPKIVHTTAPWNYLLRDQAGAMRYLGQCIAGGGLDRLDSECLPLAQIGKYLEAAADDETLLPRTGNCASSYESFVRLFETVCKFRFPTIPTFQRPSFFTDEEYERAICYFVCEKRWILSLPDSLIVENMPTLFNMIGRDEGLMRRLIYKKFCGFEAPSVILVMLGQAGSLSGALTRLAGLVFSQTTVFAEFAESGSIQLGECYNAVLESGILPKMIRSNHQISQFNRFVVSFILFFKDDPEKMRRIVASITNPFTHPNGSLGLWGMRWSLNEQFLDLLGAAGRHAPEDVNFVRETFVRFGWLRQSEI